MSARFELGQCHATQAALGALTDNQAFPIVFLKRHESGDWGDVSEAEARANEISIQRNLHIASRYRLPDGQRIQVITEPDRTHTLVKLETQ